MCCIPSFLNTKHMTNLYPFWCGSSYWGTLPLQKCLEIRMVNPSKSDERIKIGRWPRDPMRLQGKKWKGDWIYGRSYTQQENQKGRSVVYNALEKEPGFCRNLSYKSWASQMLSGTQGRGDPSRSIARDSIWRPASSAGLFGSATRPCPKTWDRECGLRSRQCDLVHL